MSGHTHRALGKYLLLARLGEGGMGTVFQARDDMLDRDVAIKVLRPDLVQQQALVARFRTEAVALARLAHPRIATLYGLERDGHDLFMVMEFLHGETLETLVRRTGPLPWPRAVALCAQIAEALEHAHAQGVVHRDIKPANVMVRPGDQVKVMDFGIARMSGSHRLTRVGHAVGTPDYMAPEQLRGEEGDGRIDLYALGAVLYELVTGRVAFEAESDHQRMLRQLHEPPPAPSMSAPSLPAVLDAIVLRALAKRPEDRFRSATEMRDALLESLDASPAEGRAVTPAWLDWRSWVTVTLVAATVAVLLRGTASDDVAPEATTLPMRAQAIEPRVARDADALITASIEPRVVSGPPPAAPPPANAPEPRPVPPVTPPIRRPQAPPATERAPVSPPRAAPAEPSVDAPPTDTRAVEEAARAAAMTWLATLGAGTSVALEGRVDREQAARLLQEERLTLVSHDALRLGVDGNRATARVATRLSVRSAFGARRERSVRLRLELVRSGERWRVSRAVVDE